jgi:hypothetical protein
VIPVTQKLGPVRIVSVELYQDGLVVRWIAAASGMRNRYSISVGDDRNTLYASAGSGSFGNDVVERGESTFVPAVPSAARELKLTLGKSTVSVPIRAEP